MPSESAYLLAKRIEADVKRLLARGDSLPSKELMALVATLKRDTTDARLDVRDYEFAETRAEQQRVGSDARKRLEAVRRGVLSISQHGMVSAVDVAELSARIDYLVERLE